MQQVDEFIGEQFETSTGSVVTVVGVSEKKSGIRKLYLCSCSVCSLDKELFPDLFKSRKSSLKAGNVPCGCSKRLKWTKDQFQVRCKREAEKRGLGFNGFSGEWKGNQTKLKLVCEKHGEWETTSISSFFSGRGCPTCAADKTKETNTKPDQVMIGSFMASGAFKEGTKFWRSERKNSQGYPVYWYYSCPTCSNDEYVKAGLCDGVFEIQSNNLQKGLLACRCSSKCRWTQDQREYQLKKETEKEGSQFIGWVSKYSTNKSKFHWLCKEGHECKSSVRKFLDDKQRCPTCAGHAQQQGYINTISDGDTLIGLKFGIARDSSIRVKKQNSKSIFTISPLQTYNFPSVEACKAAESEVKHTLYCGVFTQSEVSDGYTETCHLIDLENVMSIFSKHGGKQEITCNL